MIIKIIMKSINKLLELNCQIVLIFVLGSSPRDFVLIDDGIVIFSNDEHLKKALYPIEVIVE